MSATPRSSSGPVTGHVDGRLRPRGSTARLLVALLVSVTPAWSPDDPDDEFRPLLVVDAREHDPYELVDLRALAEDIGAIPDAEALADRDEFRVLEVIDTHVFRVATVLGEEVVVLPGARGTNPALPPEVNDYICEKAVPELAFHLLGRPLEDIAWARFHALGVVRDAAGRRLANPHYEGAERGWTFLSQLVVERGWACAAATGIPDEDLTPADVVNTHSDARDIGLRALPAWTALRESVRPAADPVLALGEDELTARAREIQAQIAALVGWRPEQEPTVTWTTMAGLQQNMFENARRRQDERAESHESWTWYGDDELEELAREHAAGAIAVAPEGPEILVRRDAPLALCRHGGLDTLLAHEIGHQYQEEALGLFDVREDEDGWEVPWQAHADHVALLWAESVGRRGPISTRDPGNSFETLLRLTGLPPDELLLRHRGGAWSGVGWERFVVSGEPLGPRPTVRCVPNGGGPVVLDISNPGDTPQVGVYAGRWAALPSQGSEAELVDAVDASPPFRLVLPPGASVRVRLDAALPGATPGAEIRGIWFDLGPQDAP